MGKDKSKGREAGEDIAAEGEEMTEAINSLTSREAAKLYASYGIVTHPLYSPTANVNSPGKQPILTRWQQIYQPFALYEINLRFSDDDNIGFVCGRYSDVTVIDIDFFVNGLWDNILKDIDISKWIKQDHKSKTWHWIFKYCSELKAGQYKALGFDILSDDIVTDTKTRQPYIAGDNCACSPSIHPDGNKYQITGDITQRIDIPEEVIKRLNNVLQIYTEITKKILPKCRRVFRDLWKAIFEDKDSDLYRDSSIFRGSFENRKRCLNFCAELKANGAKNLHLMLFCMLAFGNYFDEAISEREINYVEADKTATNETIRNDPYLSRFYQERQESKDETVSSNDFLNNAVKEMTAAEIELLKTNFAQRRLICNLPEDHFISQFVAYADRMSDGYKEYKILGAFWLLSSIVSRKPKIDLATSVDGIHLNIWTTCLGLSSISRKTTIIDMARHFLAYALGKPITDTDYSLEGYLESLSQEPIKFMVNDEVSTTYQKMGQKYNAGYFEFECKIYDGSSQNKRLASGGKRDQKTFDIKDPYVTKLTASTFTKFKRSITVPDFDSGFGYRFVYAAPTYEFNQRPLRLTTDEDITARSELEKRTALLVRLFRDMPPFTMGIEPEAMQFYIDTDIDVNKQLAKAPNQEFLASVWSRYGIYILKFAALIEIGKSTALSKITLESMKIAASMVLDYFLPTICDVYNLLTVDPTNNMIDRIIEALKASNGICAHSDLLRKTKLKSRDFKELIETMRESGQIEVISQKSEGNNKTQFFYRLIDCDAVRLSLQRKQVHQIPQVPQVPRVSHIENDEGICENLNKITKLDHTHIDVQNKQYNNSQILPSSPNESSIRYSGNLGNLDNLGNLATNQNEQDIIKNLKDLPSLRKELITHKNSYLEKYGGIESIEDLVDYFLKDCPGYLKLFSRQEIIFEAGKICKVI